MNLILPGEDGVPAAPPDPGLTLAAAAPWKKMDALDAAAQAGFRRLELGAAPGELGDPERLRGFALSGLRQALRGDDLIVGALRGDMEIGLPGRGRRQGARDAVRSLVDLAGALGVERIVARAAGTDAPVDAARYALDVLHDVADDLARAGVRLAVEAGGDVRAFLADAEARRILWAEAPDVVEAALADADLAADVVTPEAVDRLASRAGLARLGAAGGAQGGITLRRRDHAEALAGRLARSGFGGFLTVLPEVEDADAAALRAFHDELIRFLPAATT